MQMQWNDCKTLNVSILAKRMRYEVPLMIFKIPARSSHICSENFVPYKFPNLLAAARTTKLEVTQKELSDALIACALTDENAAQSEKR